MTILVSLVFLLTLFVTAYAFYATLGPALPRIKQLMTEAQPSGKPRMIHFGLDRHSVRRMEEAQKLVALKPRCTLPVIYRAPALQIRRAA